jgi:hypothetical protein
MGGSALGPPHLGWTRRRDAVAFHSLQFLVPKCRYETARQALHHADLALFPARRDGRHKAQIDEVFDGRMA